MRPVEFTPAAIIQAGQDLQTAGRNITGFALRQKVGGGNPSRLKQVWDEHQSSQVKTEAEPVAELPVEVAEVVAAVSKALTERIASLAIELNDKAVKAAERKVHEVVRSAGEQRAQAERELADAAETVDDLESKLDEVQAAAEGLETRLADSQAKVPFALSARFYQRVLTRPQKLYHCERELWKARWVCRPPPLQKRREGTRVRNLREGFVDSLSHLDNPIPALGGTDNALNRGPPALV